VTRSNPTQNTCRTHP